MMSGSVKSLLQSFRNTSGAFSSREGGYLSAFAEGLIDRNIQGKSVWAPFYTLHKIVQGMIDQYQMTGKLDKVEQPFSNPQKYNNYYIFDFKIPASTVEKAKYEGLKSIKNFKMKNGVELVPFYDAHHCRYAVYWQK